MKKLIIGVLVLGIAAGAHLALAETWTPDSIRARIAELKKEIASLEAMLRDSEPQPAWCYTFERNIGVGSSGPDVVALKEALRREGFYYNKDLSDIFNESLAASVTAFQQKYAGDVLAPVGLKYGTGFAGRSTRAKLNALYGCRGPVDLKTIQVKTPASFSLAEGMTAHVVNYQNTKITLENAVVAEDIRCITTPCPAPDFKPYAEIAVTMPGGCGIGADSSCLGPPGFSSRYSIAKGDAVEVAGLKIAVEAVEGQKAAFRISSSSDTTSGNKPPVMHGVTGPTQLGVGAAGTWTVRASDPEGASLRYSITWGDESSDGVGSGSAAPTRTGSLNKQEVSFTHSYARAGSYRITFTVSDNSGQEARSSMTVVVGERIESGGYIYIVPETIRLGVGATQDIKAYYQPPAPPCPIGYACTLAMPAPYRVEAKFTIDRQNIANLIYAIPMCIPTDAPDSYCGEMVTVQGLEKGTAAVTAQYKNFTAMAKVIVE